VALPPGVGRTLVLKLYVAALAAAVVVCLAPSGAPAHRSGCHSHHTCPSDHATYRWRGLRCVKPGADEYNRSFNRTVHYDGRKYYCKR
jgi:hypothetical protein